MMSRCFLPGSRRGIVSLVCLLLLLTGCAAPQVPYRHPPEAGARVLARMGYTVQVGAFAKVENASRLTDALCGQGIAATYFAAAKGLYKVRFGNFPSRAAALGKAETLRATGVIEEFYIVSPGEYAVARRDRDGASLREELVKTAQSFLGVPYLWGGAGTEGGFDCSGLTMTVYQLNGLDLPRTSQEQVDAGSPVEREHLSKGDLVFFRATARGKVSHVGLYAGDGLFIHAPGRGKKIRLDALSGKFYQQRYAGGRAYL